MLLVTKQQAGVYFTCYL